ncbi:methyltransferase domain-containing protein [Minwuia sp.]|uniref:methyltransferase domain-containing protein n=1 Tax=Minwuia sp. TaxID=2493630 RepID=UPI003A9074FD
MSSNPWNPEQYLKGTMGDLRTRPVFDLLARVPVDTATSVYDLGCGPGNSTAPLKARWPGATVTGIDNNPAMLEKARDSFAGITFREADIGTWEPDDPADVIFANAALHWVPDHARLLARLLGFLRPGGCLAIQQPNNFAAPSHALIGEIARDPRFRDRLKGKLLGDFVQDVRFYHDLLRPIADAVDIWETEYAQPLNGADPVLEWVRGTALLPVETNLDRDDFSAFVSVYREKLRTAYPVAPDGITLFPFRRMFIIATGTAA